MNFTPQDKVYQAFFYWVFIGVFFFILGISSAFAQETITDIDGNVYEVVQIGNQRWIKSNLRVKRYRNGDPIPEIRDPGAWLNTRQGAWCYLNNDPSTEEEHGILYNAYAFMDPRGLVPEGTFLPSACDWGDLFFELEGTPGESLPPDNFMGDKVKLQSFFNPSGGNSRPTNSSGLSIGSSGFRSGTVVASFTENAAYFWTKTVDFFLNGDPRFWVSTFLREWAWWRPVSGFSLNHGISIRVLVGEELANSILRQETQSFCGNAIVSDLQFSTTRQNSFSCAGPGNITLNCYRQILWFKDIDFTLPVPMNEQLVDGQVLFGKANHIFLNLSGNESIGLCQEEILEVTVRILEPQAPTGEETQVFCAGASVQDLKATGDEIRWYQTQTATTPIAPNTLLQNGRFYFAENRSGNCINPTRFRIQVELVSPTAPTASATQEVCAGTTLADLAVQGQDLVWYSEAGVELSPETVVTDNVTYQVASKVSNCESDRVSVRVVLTGPAVPTAAATQNFCPGARVSDLSADGQNLRWYITPTGGTPLAVETPLEDGREYFVTQTIEGCESRSRQSVRVTVAPVPAVTAPSLQDFCNAATISSLQATGTNIRWYADQNLSVELTGNIPLGSGQTYYATQSQNGCESVPTAVQVAINAVEAPQGNTEQGFCPGATVANLTASGTNIRWYATATGGTALAPTALLQNGITYFAEQQAGSCQSATRLAVRVAISSTDLPTATANQTLCIGATVNELTATGQNIRWYASATETTPLPNTEQLVDGRTYFASQTIDGCESAGRSAVQVRVVNVSSPTAPQSQSFCNAATVSNLQATGTAIRWYSDQNLTQLLTPNSPLENGRTYYATQTQDNCESTAVSVQVSITSVAAPTGAVEQEFCNGAFVDELTATGTAVQWFSTATGGSPLAGNLPLQDGITYYAEQTVGNCTSANRLAVRVRINTPQLPGGASQQAFCEGTPVSALQATGSNLVWYQNATGPELLNPNELIQDGSLYYVSQRIGNCESERKEIRVSIISVESAIAEGEQQFCESESPTVGSLFAVGDEIRWYSSPTGGQVLSDSEQLINGQTYYAANVANGCESSTRTAVNVIVQPCEVEVFNMVTRNRDPKNNFLKVKNIESFPDNRMEIFNRYGVLVWATDGYGQGDKLFYGESNQPGISQPELGLPTGNYLYVLTYENPLKFTKERITGYLYLINELRNQ